MLGLWVQDIPVSIYWSPHHPPPPWCGVPRMQKLRSPFTEDAELSRVPPFKAWVPPFKARVPPFRARVPPFKPRVGLNIALLASSLTGSLTFVFSAFLVHPPHTHTHTHPFQTKRCPPWPVTQSCTSCGFMTGCFAPVIFKVDWTLKLTSEQLMSSNRLQLLTVHVTVVDSKETDIVAARSYILCRL